MQRSLLAFLVLCATAPAASSASAQGGPPPRSDGRQRDTVTVGLGVGVTTRYDGASDYKFIPGGTFRGTVSGHDFQLNGPQLFVDAIPNDPQRKVDIEFGPVAGARFNRTGDVGNDKVAALGELDTAVELGARGSLGVRGLFNRADKVALAVTGVWDISVAHRSHVFTPSLEYSTLAGSRTYLRMALATEFVGKGYADYYFAINAAGATASGLPIYAPDGGLASVGGNVLAIYSLSGGRTGWALFGIASYKRLQGDIAASPIVQDTGSPNQFFASLGVGYSF